MAIVESLHQHRCGQTCNKEHVRAACQLIDELEHHAEHMCQRKHRNNVVCRAVGNMFLAVGAIGGKASIRQHHTLRVRSCAGSVVDECKVVQVVVAIVDISSGVTIGILGFESCFQIVKRLLIRFRLGVNHREIFHADDGLDLPSWRKSPRSLSCR